MKRQNKEGRRFSLVLAVISIWASLLIARLIELQVFQHNFFSKRKITQTRTIEKIIPRRGTIFDRNGEVLALSVESRSAFVREALSPKELKKVKNALGLTDHQITKIIRRWRSGKKFTWLKRKLSDDEYKKLASLKIEKIQFIKEPKRVYPQGALAAHILGGVNIDNKGVAGVELALENYIGGVPGEREILLDALGYPIDIKTLKPMIPGNDIRLTIDSKIQHVVEKALLKGIRRFNAKRGAAVVLNRNGEVIAMASFPNYDPNFYSKFYVRNREALKNFAVSLVYPPGSTLKVFDMAIALEKQLVKPDEVIFCENGKIRSGKRYIKDHEPYGKLSATDIIVHSSNVGAIKITRRIPDRIYYKFLLGFGFGEKTGIELPGETAGILRPPEKWMAFSKDYIAIGQEIAVSPLQMASALLSLVNLGEWVQPHLTFKTPLKRKILSADASKKILKMMVKVVERGTGHRANLGWISSGGKTGTAEKILHGKKIGYTPSFVGFIPYPEPKYVVTVVIDEPRGKYYYGADVAVPVFKEIETYLLMNSNIYPVVMQ